ncbi:sulfate permease [Hoyosella sp. G463]|uniref:Sulfate permease n=1 Tax=Lolliginicoccus lacisalsi TaxID=2742202 RepID=A0A927JE96_9ACTN|nr:sulfate permease [Lolliginicoccus lacisalsi]MBD8506772.1 sulfate permease [Lolliginicoccus lacisalsi]
MATANEVPRNVVALRHYQRRWLRADVLAGITVAAYLIPQVMAYAAVAGLPPVVGLWAIGAALVIYAILGTSRQLSVGPESTTALMTAVAIGPLAAGDPARYASLAALLALLVGIACILGWAARLGFLADLLSRPVLVGYMAGIALIMIVSQLGTITGTPVDGDSATDRALSFLGLIGDIHWPTFTLAAATTVFLLAAHARWPLLPIPLIAVILAAVVTAVFSLRDIGIAVVGAVPQGLPAPSLPSITGDDLSALLLPAVGVAIVGYSDNVLTARSFAARNNYRIDANKELLALGSANLGAAAINGFPVSSSASRTALGDSIGSRTQLHSLAALAVVIVVLYAGGPILELFPTAALGALVVFAATRLIDVREFRRIAAYRSSELVLALVTTFSVLLLGVLYGVIVAIVLSILDLLRRVARPHDGILGQVPGLAGMHDIDDYPNARRMPGLVVYRYDAPLFFANAADFHRRAVAAVDSAPTPTEWLVLNAEAMIEIDLTATDMLEEMRVELEKRGITLALARVKQELRADLDAAGLLGKIGEEQIFPTLPTAVDGYLRAYKTRHGHPPQERPKGPMPP